MATFPANYDLAFSGGVPYVSGSNSTAFGADNAIWRLDTSGNNQPTEIAAVGGFAAGIAFDSRGDLYYGTDLGSNNKLVEFTAAQVRSGQAKRGSPLTLADATVLSDLPAGARRRQPSTAQAMSCSPPISRQQLGRSGSTLGMWNGTAGNGNNYTVIGTGRDNRLLHVRAAPPAT